MRFRNLDLLTLLISLFVFAGCENPNGIGLDIDPDNSLNSDTITLNVDTKLLKEDSIPTNLTQRSVLAYIKDDIFGTTTSNIAMAVTLPTSNLSFGTNPILDSAVLVLPYAGMYGDSVQSYTVDVKQLDEILYKTSNPNYYNTKVWKTKPTIIDSKSFRPIAYNDSVSIKLYGYQDSVVKVIPQLRIPLNNTFIVNNIISLDSATLSTSEKFANAFKGLYLSINQATAPTNGGAVSFDTYTSGASRIDLFYRTTNSSGTLDTTSVSLPISGSLGNAVSEIKWDVSPTVQNELDNPTLNNGKLYIKSLAGTRVKVTIPSSELGKLKDAAKYKNVAINRAELIIPVEEHTSQPTLSPLGLIRIHRFDIAKQPQLIQDESTSDPRYMGPGFVGGFYNTTSKETIINVTGYFQDLLKGKTKDYGTFISSYDHVTGAGRLNYVGSTVTNGGGSTDPKKVKLKIYYTDLK